MPTRCPGLACATTPHYQALGTAGTYTDWFSQATLELAATGTLEIPAHAYRVLVR